MPTHLIGNDAFQECDTVGITRPCTKHNWLVRDVNDLAKVLHEAFYVATTGRPGPVLVDVPKDVQFATGTYHPPRKSDVHVSYTPRVKGDARADPQGGGAARRRKAPGDLFRRRRHQFRV